MDPLRRRLVAALGGSLLATPGLAAPERVRLASQKHVVRCVLPPARPERLQRIQDSWAADLARHGFIRGIENGYVAFHYRGFHQALVRERITAADLAWASCLLDRLSDRQWQDAFRAGGYAPDVAQRFIRTLEDKIAVGRRLGSMPEWTPYDRY